MMNIFWWLKTDVNKYMLTLNKELVAVVRENGDVVEYDYDPLLGDLNDRKEIDACLKFMKDNHLVENVRVARVKLVELTD